MNFLDVTGGGRHLVNLDQVRRIKHEDFGQEAEIGFLYADGSEDTFKVTSGRLAVLLDTLFEAQIA